MPNYCSSCNWTDYAKAGRFCKWRGKRYADVADGDHKQGKPKGGKGRGGKMPKFLRELVPEEGKGLVADATQAAIGEVVGQLKYLRKYLGEDSPEIAKRETELQGLRRKKENEKPPLQVFLQLDHRRNKLQAGVEQAKAEKLSMEEAAAKLAKQLAEKEQELLVKDKELEEVEAKYLASKPKHYADVAQGSSNSAPSNPTALDQEWQTLCQAMCGFLGDGDGTPNTELRNFDAKMRGMFKAMAEPPAAETPASNVDHDTEQLLQEVGEAMELDSACNPELKRKIHEKQQATAKKKAKPHG